MKPAPEFPGLPAVAAADLTDRLARLRAAFRAEPFPPWAVRQRRLQALYRLLRDNEDAIVRAIDADFGGRSAHETKLLELFPTIEAVRHMLRHGRRWMKAQRRPTGLWFLPGRSQVVVQPLGVVGVIVPWNYPVFLALAPLANALAAGNRVMLKMSELTPALSALCAGLVARYFQPDEVDVVLGDADVGAAFAALPFDHLLFTGSTRVGHAVMRAAADNLTPVTLELGGKSPAIVAPGYPLAHAAERIALGKTLNAGQTCIAPDYALVPEGAQEAFIAELRRAVARCYPDLAATPDYSSIINDRHYARLTDYLDEAAARGARVLSLAPGNVAADAARRRLPPVALLDVTDDMRVMQEEIFGPLLPVLTYRQFDDALAYVNNHPRPLALYLFDRDGARVNDALRRTHAGGVTVNDVILHIAQEELPFGGIGPSGMGHYHGHAGFLTFSKQKGVFRQARVNGLGLFNPPYNARFQRFLKLLMR